MRRLNNEQEAQVQEQVQGQEQGLSLEDQIRAKAARISEIKDEIGEISQAMQLEDSDKAALQERFKALIVELSALNKIGKKTTSKKTGTGTSGPRTTKLGALKGALVSFAPRNTAIELEGTITAIGVDGRNGFHILTITHATGMKFTKKVDAVQLVEPTEEQAAQLEALVAEQAALIGDVKAAKAVPEAEAEPETVIEPSNEL